MKRKYVFVTVFVLMWLMIIGSVAYDRAIYGPHHKITDADALGLPPQASKPYNILDYTKPTVKP